MKKLLILFMLMTAVSYSRAQSPTTDPDTVRNSSKQTDPEAKQMPADLHYINESVRIDAEELPAAVLESLKKSEPQVWQKSVVYKQKREDVFEVEIRDGGDERYYRFNKEGKQLNSPDEQQQD
jgi:hypothetical protein